jgi:hypothetical protein
MEMAILRKCLMEVRGYCIELEPLFAVDGLSPKRDDKLSPQGRSAVTVQRHEAAGARIHSSTGSKAWPRRIEQLVP